MSETNEKSIKKNEIDIKDFRKVKEFLISYYQNVGSSQSVRLIGFTAGLFTLIGAIKLSPDEHLGKFFSEAFIFQLYPSNVSIPQDISLAAFTIAIFILAFFIFRAIFRYMSFSQVANMLLFVTLNDVMTAERKRKEQSPKEEITLHAQIINALRSHIEKEPKVVGMSIYSFISFYGNPQYKWGVRLCVFLSTLSTFFLLLLLW